MLKQCTDCSGRLVPVAAIDFHNSVANKHHVVVGLTDKQSMWSGRWKSGELGKLVTFMCEDCRRAFQYVLTDEEVAALETVARATAGSVSIPQGGDDRGGGLSESS